MLSWMSLLSEKSYHHSLVPGLRACCVAKETTKASANKHRWQDKTSQEASFFSQTEVCFVQMAYQIHSVYGSLNDLRKLLGIAAS